jgi:hypothetical protein
MPVVVVTAPALADVDAALVALTHAVADALELPPDGVYATAVTTTAGVLGATPRSWPVVVLHGGRRDPGRMAAAASAAEAVVRDAWQVEDVWVQWAVRE